MENEVIRGHIHRYFVAVYGQSYVFRAPETFGNILERWMLAIASGHNDLAEQSIVQIENFFKEPENITNG